MLDFELEDQLQFGLVLALALALALPLERRGRGRGRASCHVSRARPGIPVGKEGKGREGKGRDEPRGMSQGRPRVDRRGEG